MSVEAKIKSYMEQKGIPQIELSKKTGITPPKLNLTLNGHRRLTFPEYELICGALDLPVNQFLTARKKEVTQ